MSIEFAAVARPTVTRTSEPNPFNDLAAALAGDRDATLGFTIALPADADAKALIGKVKRQIAQAAAPHGITVRAVPTVTAGAKGKPGSIAFSVWAVDKIKRGVRATPAAKK